MLSDYCIEGIRQDDFLKEVRDGNISFISEFLTMLGDNDLFDKTALKKEKNGATYSKTICSFLIGAMEHAILFEQDEVFSLLLDAVVNNYEVKELFGITRSIAFDGSKNNIDILSSNKKVMVLGEKFWMEIMEIMVKEDKTELSEYIIKNKLLKDINAFTSTGSNLLILAVINDQMDHVELLLNNGADKDLEDKSGRTALEFSKIRIFSIREYVQDWDVAAYKQRVFEENFAKSLPKINARKKEIKSKQIKKIQGVKL